ncbi:Hypothetical protein A7982_06727 [Minicystis rosea]|nr:Hypothetical protein A7982_06727 [Minicystis rosea]
MILVVGAAGCLPQTSGELDNGGFTYFCSGKSDLACTDGIINPGASNVPPAIAVGAHFDLEFSPPIVIFSKDEPTPVASIVSVSPSILSQEPSQDVGGTGFRFTAPGTVAVLAKSATGEVVDFVHVTGANVEAIAFVDRFGDETQALTLASTQDTLQALPRDTSGNTLAGSLSYEWTTSDDEIVSLSPGFENNEIKLVAGKPGKATITVTVQSTPASIEVTVGGAP